MTTDLQKASDARIRANGRSIYRAAAAGLMPDPREKVSDWAQQYRVVPDMGSLPGPWKNHVAPELVEIMDCLSPDHPSEQVVLIKPSQSGGSAVAENWIGYIMHRTPGPAMYVGPTVKGAKDWIQEKLGPTINATPVLAPHKGGAVAPAKSRSGEGTTSERIRFKGGFLLLAGANSAATLRQHSIRFMVRDDRSAWTDNADNEGDPKDLSDARLKTFRVYGLAKVFDVSSPKFKDADIDAEYQKGDRRHYYMACLGCGAANDWEFEDLVHNDVAPFRSHLICPLCQHEHFEADKKAMKAGGCWVPTAPDLDGVLPPKSIRKEEIDDWRRRRVGPGNIVSFSMTGVTNTFERWDNLVARSLAAGDDPVKLQPFENSDLGRPYEPKSEGPSWEVLSARREMDWARGNAPAGVLYTTFTVDVQGDGLYWSSIGWGPNKECWHLDHGFIAGTSDVPHEGAWPKLDMVVERGVAFGPARIAPDMIAVDSGYNSDAVYSWVKRRHNAIAIKGSDGWTKLPIYGAEAAEIRKHGLSAGKAKRHGMKVWMVGTYGIKAALMIYLSRGMTEGQNGALPSGYQHFPGDTEEDYFRHLVSEFVTTIEDQGEKKRVWKKRGENHWLDCAVYGWALTHYVGLWNWSDEQWAERAKLLTDMLAATDPDLFGGRFVGAVTAPPVANRDVEAENPPEGPAVTLPKTKASRNEGLDALAMLNR
ncbi:phage terminase large subunit family protein [Devosia sp. Leaf420]|uniref:phage terminase large subunit family protein n=1 Tax=Devosia sp. Leaf420 TaxID=1736374 RepID=UPI000B0D22F1|nr:terminase gpA endonuclease subunit [Devosia sp. Leaf420]